MRCNLPGSYTSPPPIDSDVLIHITGRLPQTAKLKVMSSNFFARNVQRNIQRIRDNRCPLRLRLNNNCSVIVIDNKTYEELEIARVQLISLIKQMEKDDIANLAD